MELIGEGASEARERDKTQDEMECLKTAEHLGKRYGLFIDKHEVKIDVPAFFDCQKEIPD